MLEPHCTFIGGYQSHGIAQLAWSHVTRFSVPLQWDSEPTIRRGRFWSTAYTISLWRHIAPESDDAKILCYVSAASNGAVIQHDTVKQVMFAGPSEGIDGLTMIGLRRPETLASTRLTISGIHH